MPTAMVLGSGCFVRPVNPQCGQYRSPYLRHRLCIHSFRCRQPSMLDGALLSGQSSYKANAHLFASLAVV